MGLLLAITFVYGPLRWLTGLRIFQAFTPGLLLTIFIDVEEAEPWYNGFRILCRWLDQLIFYGSLIYQAYFWLDYWI